MNVTTLFTQINGAYRGTDDDAPTTGVDFDLWLATANRKQSEWAGDSTQLWRSLYSTDTLAPVVAAGTQTYNLPTTFVAAANRVKVTNGTNYYYYDIIQPQEAMLYVDGRSNAAYISGSNPQKLTFVDTITATDPIVGGTITVNAYHTLADLVDGDSTVLVDDPYWLVYAVASELAFNDITYSDKAPDLNAKANSLYTGMVKTNRSGTNNNPRTARTNVQRIIGPESEEGVSSI